MTDQRATSKQRVATLAFWSIVIAFVVLALKLFAWKITGSVALYSDALESIVNVIASVVAFWAITVSHKPADNQHQHGHHKAEYFSAVVEGALIIVAVVLATAAVALLVWRSAAGWASAGRKVTVSLVDGTALTGRTRSAWPGRIRLVEVQAEEGEVPGMIVVNTRHVLVIQVTA